MVEGQKDYVTIFTYILHFYVEAIQSWHWLSNRLM